MSEKTTGEDMLFEHDPKGAFAQFVAPMAGYGVTMASFFRPTVTEQYPREPARVMPRFHGRHQLNRYDDGLEKCVGCELCAWACPADAIFVEAASNTPDEQYSAGERYGRVYQINYLRCIFCGLCIEACPTRALTMTNEYELADNNRADLIFTKEQLLAPLQEGMLPPPHPMVAGTEERDYYQGKVATATDEQRRWVDQHTSDRDASGSDASGHDASGHDASGHDASGHDTEEAR